MFGCSVDVLGNCPDGLVGRLFLAQNHIRVLKDFAEFSPHFRVSLTHFHQLLLDQIDVLFDKVFVVFEIFSLIIL